MTRKELVEQLLKVGNDESEVQELFDGSDTAEITSVMLGRTTTDDTGEDYEADPEIIFLNTTAL